MQRRQVHCCDLDRRSRKCTANSCRDSCPTLLLCKNFRQLTAGLTSALLGSKTAVEVMIVPDTFLVGLLFLLAKRKSGWGICGSSWLGDVLMSGRFTCDQLCPCDDVFT